MTPGYNFILSYVESLCDSSTHLVQSLLFFSAKKSQPLRSRLACRLSERPGGGGRLVLRALSFLSFSPQLHV